MRKTSLDKKIFECDRICLLRFRVVRDTLINGRLSMVRRHERRRSPMLRHNLYTLMAQRDMTAAELARRAGCTPAYISLLMSGRRSNPSTTILLRLASALGCSVADLLDGDSHDARAC
ncbi:MAG: hypothetical protein CWE10_11555 [Symbiobacterium thermophilum]|uniref:HTH cro/C1-type domain-containing protein n=2 Tax=Symbiobacterium thermophilum TaxID=2734 RepID=A0A953IA33_SYMTR|nr:hypothetical protein [Symbiobacterium thermophilum]